MLAYAEIILAVLKLINYVMSYVNREQLIAAGRAEEIANEAQAIAVKTGVRKAIMEKVDAMSDDEVDAALRDLVRPTTGSTKPM